LLESKAQRVRHPENQRQLARLKAAAKYGNSKVLEAGPSLRFGMTIL
jgi:hypothetical protein